LCFHSTISLVGIYLFFDKPWWQTLDRSEEATTGTKYLYIDFPFQPVDPGMAWYYLVQAAYNIEVMISLLEISCYVEFQPIVNEEKRWQLPFRLKWSESCRGDFREMFVHHVFTNILILGSSTYRLSYIGSMVFLVHDISDIPVDLSKLANFLKWKKTTVICFLAMCITWLATRLFILPFIIWRSIIYESWLVCVDGNVPPMLYKMYQPLFVSLLGFLILLHFFWFTMFIRMGYVLMRKGETHDFSEHKRGEIQYANNSDTGNGATLNGFSRKKDN